MFKLHKLHSVAFRNCKKRKRWIEQFCSFIKKKLKLQHLLTTDNVLNRMFSKKMKAKSNVEGHCMFQPSEESGAIV